MRQGYIRPIALAVFLKDGLLLAAEGFDALKNEHFYRPPGGGIEFGEYGEQAVVREIKEELGADIDNVLYLGVVENIFTYQGQAGHEIIFLYQSNFVDPAFYDRPVIEAFENDEQPFKLVWKPLADFKNGNTRLYPTGLLDLLN